MKQTEITIFRKKTLFMQSCLDAAKTHPRYMCGYIDAEELQAFDTKMRRKYDINLPKMTANRKRASGLATCKMVYFKMPMAYFVKRSEVLGIGIPNTSVFWVLFSSDGKHDVGDSGDRWLELEKEQTRLTFTGLEMLRESRPKPKLTPEQIAAGKKPQKPNPNPSWTWRFTKEFSSDIRNRIIQLIVTHQDDMLKMLITDLSHMPGFGGVRKQIKALIALISAEWKRRRKDNQMPELPRLIPWVQRKIHSQISLETVLKECRAELRRHETQIAHIKAENVEPPVPKILLPQ